MSFLKCGLTWARRPVEDELGEMEPNNLDYAKENRSHDGARLSWPNTAEKEVRDSEDRHAAQRRGQAQVDCRTYAPRGTVYSRQRSAAATCLSW